MNQNEIKRLKNAVKHFGIHAVAKQAGVQKNTVACAIAELPLRKTTQRCLMLAVTELEQQPPNT